MQVKKYEKTQDITRKDIWSQKNGVCAWGWKVCKSIFCGSICIRRLYVKQLKK